MRRAIYTSALLFGAFVASVAIPQVAPSTLPSSTVWGRLGISAGPGQAIPFAILTNNLFNNNLGTAGFPLVSNGPSATPTFGVLSMAGSGKFFTQNGANINRLNDRVLIGGATVNDGAFPNVTQDWLSAFQVAAGLSSGSLVSTQFGVLNDPTNASAAVTSLFGAQSLNATSAGASTIGVSGYAVNNNATLATSAWGLYSECHNTGAAVVSCYGLEVDPRSTAATITPTPFQQGNVIGIQIACGAGLAASQDCSGGIQVVPNPNKWKKGIVFGDTALTAANGAGGNGIAIEFSRNQTMLWRNSGGTVDAEIWGNASGLTSSTRIDAPLITSNGGAPSFLTYKATGINFNSANTDTAVAINLPTGFTRFSVLRVTISHASGTLTTSTFGVFTAAAGAGTAIIAGGTANTVSTASEGTNNNTMLNSASNTTSYLLASVPNIYFRVQNAQGSAATADIIIVINPLP